MIKTIDRNPEAGAHTLVFTSGNGGILMAGSFPTSSSSTSSIGFSYIDATTGSYKYIYAGSTTDTAKRVTNIDVTSTSTVWGCGDFNLLDLLIFTVPISTNVVPASSAVTTG
jgi:hypothetical protein